MAAMFTMMNNARLGVGVEGLGQAEAALQAASAFARERRQGRTPDGEAAIVGHADVRRMLATMAALVGDGAGDLPRLRAVDRHGRPRPARRPGRRGRPS